MKGLKLLLVLGVLICGIGFIVLDGAQYIRDPQALTLLIESTGWRSIVLFSCLFILGGSLGVPPALFAVAAGLLWPFSIAFGISYCAGLGAAGLGFFLSRYLARDFCAAHIPARLKQFNRSLETTGLRSVILLRLAFYLFPPVNWMLGLSRVGLSDYLCGTMIGMLPTTILSVLLGHGVLAWLASRSPLTLATAAAGLGLLILIWRTGRRYLPDNNLAVNGKEPEKAHPPGQDPNDKLPGEKAAVSLSELRRAAGTFFRLAGQAFYPPKPYSRPPSLRRFCSMLVFLPAFALLQTLHWSALLLDEVLFPDYRQVRPDGAVFVVGIPRSGTTFLHRVLARDRERFTTLRLWELVFAPAICEKLILLGAARIDGFFGSPVRRLASLISKRLTPSFDKVHRLSLTEPEEDFLLLTPVLACFLLIVPFPFAPEMQNLARFDEKLSHAERKRVIEFYKAMLQRHLYVFGSHRILLSKNVSFTPMLRSLHTTLPKARFVICIRSPQEALASQISAMEGSWRLFGNDFGFEFFESQWLELMDYYFAHLVEMSAHIPKQQHLVVEMGAMRSDLQDCVRRLYQRFHFSLTDRYTALLREETQAAASYRSSHHYSLEAYGLNPEDIRQRYSRMYGKLSKASRL